MAAEDTSEDSLLYPLFTSQTPNYFQNERSRFTGRTQHRLWQPGVQSRPQLSLPAVPGPCPGQPPAQHHGLSPQLSTMDRNPSGAAEGGPGCAFGSHNQIVLVFKHSFSNPSFLFSCFPSSVGLCWEHSSGPRGDTTFPSSAQLLGTAWGCCRKRQGWKAAPACCGE